MEKRYYLGLFFLCVQGLAILRNYLIGYDYFFWFCDFAPLVFSIAFFIGNKDIIKSIINFGLIPQFIFLADFIYATNAGTSPLGFEVHLLNFTPFSTLITIFIHLTTFFALLLTFRIKPGKKTLFYSIIFIFAVYLVTLVFTPSTENINYVYSTGKFLSAFNFTIPFLVWLWPLLTFLLVILPTQGIQYLIYRITKKSD